MSAPPPDPRAPIAVRELVPLYVSDQHWGRVEIGVAVNLENPTRSIELAVQARGRLNAWLHSPAGNAALTALVAEALRGGTQ